MEPSMENCWHYMWSTLRYPVWRHLWRTVGTICGTHNGIQYGAICGEMLTLFVHLHDYVIYGELLALFVEHITVSSMEPSVEKCWHYLCIYIIMWSMENCWHYFCVIQYGAICGELFVHHIIMWSMEPWVERSLIDPKCCRLPHVSLSSLRDTSQHGSHITPRF